MPASALLRVVASASVVVVAATSPSDLLTETPSDGWERADGAPDTRPSDLDFVAYAAIEPDSVAHIDPASELAERITAAVDRWARGPTETLVIEIVRSPDPDTATSFVDQAAAKAIESGLAAADPPFESAWAYSGPVEDGWTRIVSWAQGDFSVTLTLRTPTESAAGTIEALASTQADRIVDVTGVAAGEAPVPEEPAPDADEGGIPVGTTLLWLGVAVATVWWFVGFRRKFTGRSSEATDGTGASGTGDAALTDPSVVDLDAEEQPD